MTLLNFIKIFLKLKVVLELLLDVLEMLLEVLDLSCRSWIALGHFRANRLAWRPQEKLERA